MSAAAHDRDAIMSARQSRLPAGVGVQTEPPGAGATIAPEEGQRMSTSPWNKIASQGQLAPDHAARAAAALLIAGALIEASPAAAAWTPGSAGNLGTFFNNKSIDIDGDGALDFEIRFNFGYGGTTIYIVPQVVDALNNEVYGEFGVTTRFNAADDILTAPHVTIFAPDWSELTSPFFQNPGYVGVIFHSPGLPTAPGLGPAQPASTAGGQDWFGYLHLASSSNSLAILDCGYQPYQGQGAVPEPPLSQIGLRALPAASGHSPIEVEFTLPTAGAARLLLIDAQGRRLAERDLAEFGAGAHRVALAPPKRLPAGIYFLRLVQGAAERTVRTFVVH